jgi:1,4-dihydroxy-6-naphthoate synthase
VNNKIDTEGIEFEVLLEDVETLNRWSFEEKLDITKLSFPAFFKSSDKYILMNSGAALGKAVGPLLISNKNIHYSTSDIQHSTIALPGENTTANLLFSFAYPEAIQKKYLVFSAIEDAVLNNEVDLGVIIHENRFTYQQRGLYKVTDLGEYWEEKMKMPIPLGGIAIKRSIDKPTSLKIESLIRKSIEYAFANYPHIAEFVKKNSQEMNEDVMRRHIELYVNNYSLHLGDDGKNAILKLSDIYDSLRMSGVTGNKQSNLFLS